MCRKIVNQTCDNLQKDIMIIIAVYTVYVWYMYNGEKIINRKKKSANFIFKSESTLYGVQWKLDIKRSDITKYLI